MINLSRLGKFIFFLLTTSILFSCTNNKYNEKLNIALYLSEGNRPELEKVLHFYSQSPTDSLKYRAACFLIENMPEHYSYSDTFEVSKYYDEIDQINIVDRFEKEELYKKIRIKYKDIRLYSISDLQYITGDYLIKSIDDSFNIWHSSKWAQHLNFDEFCEYILPYKATELQILDDWKEYFNLQESNSEHEGTDCDLYNASAYIKCEHIMKKIKKSMSISIWNTEGVPIKRLRTIQNIPYGTCDDYSDLTVAFMRANGVPCTIDYTPQWPFRSLGHSWCSLLNNRGDHIPFDLTEDIPGYPHKKEHKYSKIFRKTYAYNEELYNIRKNEKYTPVEFRKICFKDVTNEYIKTIDIEIPLSKVGSAEYAYLAVFDNKKWIPIYYGKITNKKALFKDMGCDVVYLPICYNEDGTFYPIHNPIKVTSQGNIVSLITNMENNQDLVLYRKYPFLHNPDYSIKRMNGGRIQASNNIDFYENETLYTITESSLRGETIDINPKKVEYQYWRYLSPINSFGNIAELVFWETDSLNPSRGKIIGTDGSLLGTNENTKYVVFDNDPLTFFDAPFADHSWVGIDFGKKVSIGKVKYLPRGDGNNIEPNNTYELYYWDNSWRSIGIQNAISDSLIYKDCPRNTLFLLKNLTNGQEERIFTYENNRQKWW